MMQFWHDIPAPVNLGLINGIYNEACDDNPTWNKWSRNLEIALVVMPE